MKFPVDVGLMIEFVWLMLVDFGRFWLIVHFLFDFALFWSILVDC